jgi:hypothetical protein
MKSPNITSGRMVKTSAGWLHGVNSVRHPWSLPQDQFKWGVNVTVRGGIVQTRPGQAMRLSLPQGNFQGGILFSANRTAQLASTITSPSGVTITNPATIYDYNGNQVTDSELYYMVFVVDGKVYFAPFPLTQPASWSEFQLQNVSLSPTVSNVNLVIATQQATLNTSGDVTITPSHRLVIIQDGISPAVYWDGTDTLGSTSPNIPLGTQMAFSGSRLWVANGNIVMASDLADPLTWTERKTGQSRGDFTFPRKVTAMVDYVGQNNDTRLIVFTDRATYSLASGVLDRNTWASTVNFQNTVYPTVGCVAPRSIAFQSGLLWWYSQGGLVSGDVATAAYLSSQVLYKDVEMARVKRFMPENLSGIAAASFENYLLYSVPYLESLNSATMVLDYAPASEWNQPRNPAWCGVWNGTRPVQWTQGVINNQPRVFHFSIDYGATSDGSYNHLWESFMPDRVDSYLSFDKDNVATTLYNRIYCQMETALLGDQMDLKQFVYADLDVSQIGGTVDVQISYRGCKGSYTPVLVTRLMALTEAYQDPSGAAQALLDSNPILNTQYRRLVTESVQPNAMQKTCESNYLFNIDKAFSLLIEWCGEMGVEALRMYQDPWQDKSCGQPSKSENLVCVVPVENT